MTPKHKAESQGKPRRMFYNKIDGKVMGLAAGGGAIEELARDALILATFGPFADSDTGAETDSLDVVGCIEMFYNRFDDHDPVSIDLEKVQTCCDAVDSYRTAKQAEDGFVFEQSIMLLGSELPTTEIFRHALKVEELHTRDNPARTSDHDSVVQAQTDLESLCKDCEDCCEQLLVTRDAAFTFAEPEPISYAEPIS